jgi:hypothetical protein
MTNQAFWNPKFVDERSESTSQFPRDATRTVLGYDSSCILEATMTTTKPILLWGKFETRIGHPHSNSIIREASSKTKTGTGKNKVLRRSVCRKFPSSNLDRFSSISPSQTSSAKSETCLFERPCSHSFPSVCQWASEEFRLLPPHATCQCVSSSLGGESFSDGL